MHAAYKGSEEVFTHFLKAGIDPNVQSDSGWIPLICAVVADYSGAVSMLLDAGADPGLDDKHGWRPTMFTCTWRHKDIAKILCNAD